MPFFSSLVFGISLFQLTLKVSLPFTGYFIHLSVGDFSIGLLLLYALLMIRFVTSSIIAHAAFVLFVVTFLSGMSNAMTDYSFNLGNFTVNYARMGGIIAMIFLLPGLIVRVGHDRLAKSTLWIVRFHVLLIVIDLFVVSPIVLLSDGPIWGTSGLEHIDEKFGSTRPVGLFTEPSFFAVYLTLSLFYILQQERNTGNQLFYPFDIYFISSALLLCASLSSLLLLILFLGHLAAGRSAVKNKKLFIIFGALALFCILCATVLSGTIMGKNFSYLVARISNIQLDNFKDSSSRQRLIGSTLLASEALAEAPLLGHGIGGANQQRLLERYKQDDPNHVAPLSLTLTPTTVLSSLGIFGFLIFLLIYVSILLKPETRLLGVGLTAVSFMWGGTFEPIVWWYISLAISLQCLYAENLRNINFLLPNKSFSLS